MNIVGNAIKFTQVGQVEVHISSETDHLIPQQISFRVKDTGAGIAPELTSKLFQVFSQADESITRKFGGTGLGLALSKRLANALNGDVILESSEENQGSTFCITIGSEIKASHALRRSEREVRNGHQADLQDLRLLVVEDSKDNQRLINAILSRQGVTLEMADNGAEGLEKALSGNHDLVLMDLQMPVMDGYTATQRLRERGYDQPIIALTAHAMTETRLECLNIGCTDFLTKPIDSAELIKIVGRHTSRI